MFFDLLTFSPWNESETENRTWRRYTKKCKTYEKKTERQ